MTDPISNMIVSIRNAAAAGKSSAVFPYSKMKMDLATILEKEGFLKSVSQKGKKDGKLIEVEIFYNEGRPKIKGTKRISKFSRRIYLKSKEIKPVKRGFGKLILSTPKGLMTDVDAKKIKVGGEALFEIW